MTAQTGQQIGHWIDGRRTPGTSGRTAPVFNPASGEQTGAVALASAGEVGAAVASAVAAARSWRSASLSRRAAVLFAFRELLHAHADELAALVTAEHGKVLADAAGEVARGLENVEFATGVPQLLKGGRSEALGRILLQAALDDRRQRRHAGRMCEAGGDAFQNRGRRQFQDA